VPWRNSSVWILRQQQKKERTIKHPRTDMNQAHIDVLEREKNLLQIEGMNLQKELLRIQKQTPSGNQMPTV
jgi:hypothetical protein